MPAWGEWLVLLACLVGVVGTILPVLPGSVLVGGAIVVWAVVEGGATAWVTALLACAVLVVGYALTILIPGRQMTAAGIPTRTLVVGGLLGIAGFFVVPVVGLPLGFVLGVYLAERVRLPDHAAAWPSTVTAMKGTGLSVLIGLVAAVAATGIWASVAVMT
ncbi:DUF456 domain-containing protein [Longivirga aurantiaca]|uniref:DUF456 domain-containing protein n=1 Tax=Longivirga aurantiaca TaxID=1837743 RepID=A0ABW1T0G5_9ACTN